MQSEQLRFGHHWQFQQILFELVVVGVLRREINATRREFVLFEKQRGREVVRQDVWKEQAVVFVRYAASVVCLKNNIWGNYLE
jgi:hypothetical protein